MDNDMRETGSHEMAMERRAFAGLACVGALSAALALAPRAAQAQQPDAPAASDEGGTITASATVTVPTTPDLANVSLSIQAAGSDLAQIQADLSSGSQCVRQALIDAGIADGDIAISDMRIEPHYADGENVYGVQYQGTTDSDDEPQITGYTAYVDVDLTNLEISELGGAIAAGVGAGANGVSGISYTCSTYDDVYEQALAQACARACEKADVMAQALGRERGAIISVEEGYEDQSAKTVEAEAATTDTAYSAAQSDSGANSISFDPGTARITASVDITFALA